MKKSKEQRLEDNARHMGIFGVIMFLCLIIAAFAFHWIAGVCTIAVVCMLLMYGCSYNAKAIEKENDES